MRHNQEIAWVIVFGSVAILVGFVVWKKADKSLDPNCYESPSSADIGRTLLPVIRGPDHHGGLYTCGLYSRPALPDVIRCYELNRGCSE